jgi:sugar phosphate isomerase/epimerase
MKNIVAVSTNSFHGFDIMETLETIAKAGFKYIEICAVRNWTEHVMPDMDPAKLEAVKAKMAELGIKCIAMSGHCDLSDAARLADFRANMQLAADLGCEWIISSTGEAHFGIFTIVAIALVVLGIWGLVRPYHEATDLSSDVEKLIEKGTKAAKASA